MKQIRRGFFVAGLLLAAAGCSSVGYSGPDLYSFKDGYADATPQYGSAGIHILVPCYPRAPYVVAGLRGPAGPSGSAGTTGLSGLSGTTGLQGPAGLKGPTGLQGPAGMEGSAGIQGPAGVQGSAGAPGPSGSAGMQGPAGSQGPAGVPGPVGPPGPGGRVGPRGGLPGPSGPWASIETVNFEFESAGIQPKCAEKIARLATWMNDNQPVVLALDGHVNDSWANDNDPTLSVRRVQAVRDALIAAGVAPSRISVGTFGARGPVCRETTDACRELNRRVEILAAAQQ